MTAKVLIPHLRGQKKAKNQKRQQKKPIFQIVYFWGFFFTFLKGLFLK